MCNRVSNKKQAKETLGTKERFVCHRTNWNCVFPCVSLVHYYLGLGTYQHVFLAAKFLLTQCAQGKGRFFGLDSSTHSPVLRS